MLEQMYTDFTTNMLPKIQEGLVITKDYFTDLFGRYVKYLIITDSLAIVLGITFIVSGIYSIKILVKKLKAMDSYDEAGVIVGIVASGIFIIIGFAVSISNIDNLIKDFYIPEVRVYEELNARNNQTH